jgi:hypothetical protein
MSKSAPGIVDNCVIIGDSFFDLDKVSFINKPYKGSSNIGDLWSCFEFVCDGTLFEVLYFYKKHNKETTQTIRSLLERFEDFNREFIDVRFDKSTRDSLKDKKFI